jgi:hypothetical protein
MAAKNVGCEQFFCNTFLSGVDNFGLGRGGGNLIDVPGLRRVT